MASFLNSVPFGNTITRTLITNYDSLRVDSYDRSGKKIYSTVTSSISASYSTGSAISLSAVPPDYTAQGPQASFYFNGSGSYFYDITSPNPQTNFTVNIWCRPIKTIVTPPQISNGLMNAFSGHGFLIDPVQKNPGPGSGVGISIGKNAVVVVEHGASYAPTVLVYTATFSTSSFTNICLVYRDRQPNLYVNGSYVYTGLTGAANPPTLIPWVVGSSINGWGHYQGDLSLLSIYTSSLSDLEIFQNYNVLRSRYKI
jgi:hypothetical protein